MNNENTDLAKLFVDYMKELPENSNKTMDDFFDHVNLPINLRNDFAVAAILKQAKELGF